MQESQQNIQRYEEYEIDLRELLRTLMKNRVKIVLITSLITIGAVIYAYMTPKTYQVKAIIKIGEYKLANANANDNANAKVVIANASELSKELEILFIDILKNDKDREAKIDLLKKQKNFLEISAVGSSNKVASSELKKVIDYVQGNHKKILDDVKNLREAQAQQIEGKLTLLKNKTLPALLDKINRYKKDITIYETNFLDVQSNLKKIKEINPTLATIQINEQRYLADMLIKLKDSLEGFENEKNNIEVVQIEKYEEELNALKVLMKPYNYKNSEVIGNIMTNDYPIAPKKKLIVVVAFVTGLILSIFIVFFMEFIKGFKEEEKEA
ncbi:hypothetical protein HUE87_09185 [Candidatus Sulfurimonas marisnigri]|uniref:Polysaccharide chain length determinant N-terminal domain-containing protein n=1 Tax=Candidatus Sulfurimonas marisnigri TaxID=2740405 RepID=A0A7S7LZB9_9BACT|nr:Wzz/FepE/Etk N-terminal domain-containing protein [Candidatus Sulfurimonas marisnigri]QOY54050.1 hypothetical protein HUE87_09185 [Candidatus Sulfurimonas marisnigri]